ncbi:MAG: hypothetical protein V4687_03890 [Bacteroidota bacterium]
MNLSLTKTFISGKKPAILLTAFLLILSSCKKQDDETKPLKTKIVGKWEVSKVETSIGSSAPTTVAGSANDYVDFKGGDDDIVEISVSSSLQSGTYSILVSNEFYITIGGKLYQCSPTLVDDNSFEFTATEEGSNPLIIKKYFLER